MIPNIIHNYDRADRFKTLIYELKTQKISDYMMWNSIHDEKSPQRGINRAHKKIVKWAKQENLDEVLIFEDDIKFCGKQAFEYFIYNKPIDFDIYLGGIYFGKIEEDNSVKQFGALHCYIVNKRFYDTFLNVSDDEHLDGALAGLGKYIVCNPFAAVQYNGYSDNNKRYYNYDVLLENRKLLMPLGKIGIENNDANVGLGSK